MYTIKMSEMQKAYYIGREDSQSGGVGTHIYLEMNYEGDTERFQKTINKIIAAQPFLRARATENYEFIIEDSLKYEIEVIDTPRDNKEAIKAMREKYEQKVYGKEDYPLFTIKLIGNQNQYRICMSVDMLIADGLSLYQFCHEVKKGLQDPDVTFSEQSENLKYMVDYYQKERSSSRYYKARDYYMKNLENLSGAPYLSYVDGNNDAAFSHLESVYSKQDIKTIEKKANLNNLSVNDVLYTMFSMVIAKWSRYSEFSINMTTFVRPREEKYRHVFGDFTTSMLVQTEIFFDKDFVENVNKTKSSIFRAFKYSSFEVTEIVRELNKGSNGVLMPIVYTSMMFEENELWNDELSLDYWRSQTPQVYLDCQMKNINGCLNVTWDYRKAMFHENQIEKMFEEFNELIRIYIDSDTDVVEAYCKNSNRALVEKYKKYNQYTIDSITLPEQLHSAFLETLQKYGKKTFVTCGKKKYTFQEVYELAQKVAAEIEKIKNETRRGKTRIVFFGHKTIESIVNIIASILTGDSFCVMNAQYGKAKVEEVLAQLKNYILIEDGVFKQSDNWEEISQEELYILFTSGTTGKAKGIIIEEKAALNTVVAINKMYSVTSSDVLMNISNLYFDLSVYDILTALITGAELVLVDPMNVQVAIDDMNHVTIWNSTPALAKEYALNHVFPRLRLFLLSGDFVPL